MIRQDDEQFSDPSLRAAVRRSFGHERAPETLRQSIQAAIGAGWVIPETKLSPAQAWRDRWARWNSVVYASIAAGVVLFGITFLTMSYLGYFDRPSMYAQHPPLAEVPAQLADAMIARHTACAKLKDHHLIAGDDPAALKSALEKQLGFPVAVVMPGDGWVFKGAGRCQVEAMPAAHLLFARGKQEVSVFSLPPAPVRAVSTITEYYQSDCHGYPLAGVDGGVARYFAVGSSPDGSLTLNEVAAIRDAFVLSVPEVCNDACGVDAPAVILSQVLH